LSPAGNDDCIQFKAGGSGSKLDCHGRTMTGGGSYYGLDLWSATDMIVQTCTVTNFGDGLHIYNADRLLLRGNHFDGNDRGVYANQMESATIFDNTFSSNTLSDGFAMDTCHSNTFQSNTFNSNGRYGFTFSTSDNCVLIGNTANSNGGSGLHISSGSDNTDMNGNTARYNAWTNNIRCAYSTATIIDRGNNVCDNRENCNNLVCHP
jgi:parallel beta-helix repeat protein